MTHFRCTNRSCSKIFTEETGGWDALRRCPDCGSVAVSFVPVTCQKCESIRVIGFAALCENTFHAEDLNTREEYYGLVPPGPLSEKRLTNYLNGKWCLDCGHLQGNYPCVMPLKKPNPE